MKKKVLMLVTQDPIRDPRIHWEASTLSKNNYEVEILGLNEGNKAKKKEKMSKFGATYVIKRIKTEKVNLHLLRYYILVTKLTKDWLLLAIVSFLTVIYTFVLISTSIILSIKRLMRSFKHMTKFKNKNKSIKALKNLMRQTVKNMKNKVLNLKSAKQILKINNTLHYLSYVTLLFMKEKEIQRNKYDYIHCNDLDTLLVGILLKKRLKAKLVYDCHELWPESLPDAPYFLRMYLRLYEKALIIFSDYVLVVTPHIKQIMEDWYKVTNIETVPNTEYFIKYNGQKNRQSKQFENKIVFLYQGGYAEERGLEYLIQYWNELNSDKVMLILRGRENEYSQKLRVMARSLIKDRKVMFAKPVSENNLVKLSRGYDVGVIPYEPASLNNTYCCPNKLSQYMHAGLALMSNKLPFVKETIEKNCLGLCYDSDDKQSFLTAVNRLITDADFLDKCKKNAYRFGSEHFNWQKQEVNFLKIYKSLS